MLRSLFTGIAGLSAHQQMLDVTSNNIANVNTVGFKSSSTVFEDTLSQTLTGAGAPTATSGGTNATQIGLGVKLAATDLNFTEGAAQSTGVSSNMMINGDGFFVVDNGGQQEYTRAGAFTLNSLGQLVSPDGSIAEGYLLNVGPNQNNSTPTAPAGTTQAAVAAGTLGGTAVPGTPTVATSLTAAQTPQPLSLGSLVDGKSYVSYSIDSNGYVNAVDASGNTTQIARIALATFSNPNGLTKSGDTEFIASASSGSAVIGVPGTGSLGSVTSGSVEMSNVNLATELSNLIISERGFQANSKVISTSDEVLQTLVNLKQ